EERAVAYYTTAAGRQDPHYAEAMALISNVLSLHTRYEASREAAAIALELLPQSDYWLRMTVSQACEYARPTPDWYSYRAMLLEYLPQIVAHGHQILVANQYAFLAGAESNLGNFTVALEYVRRSFEATDKFLHPERPTFMAIHRARMTVAYHRSSIGEAELYRRQFEKVTKESYSFPSLALALACRALFCYLRADLEQVEPCLRESLRLSPYGVFGISPSVSFMRYVTDNGLMDLRKFLSEQAKTYGETREFKRLTFVSDLALGGGSRIEQLRTVVPAIENERRLDKVQGNLVLALYEEQAGEARAAEQALRQALTWAEPEQITQLFYNDYEYVLPVIERLKETAAPGSFTHRLYVHLSQLATGELSLAKADEQHLLTMRENEVVYLLVAGYTPQETAERLGISKETVRKHIVNAYRKLGVHSRTQLLLKIQ
ncbi:MAG: LuxR C-terminal-related transcriptional regulator, partial [Coriobacteriales bacterium]|nr:LuxR C-terminal-related transcriptional regulator [Coriobacteriales bacterium]